MKKSVKWIFALAWLYTCTPGFAQNCATSRFPALRPGDVILISLRCYSCRVIGTTTESPFTHSGIVLRGTEPMVAQSLGVVEPLPLQTFLHQAVKGSLVMVRRSSELNRLFSLDHEGFARAVAKMEQFFDDNMRGRGFDTQYLWDNYDEDGHELLYCSEMVQKTLNAALVQPLATSKMDFTRDWDYWSTYFNGRIPQGAQGNSPASLSRAAELITIFACTTDKKNESTGSTLKSFVYSESK